MPKKVKNTTLPGLLDLIAPHSCRGCGKLGTVLCDCCKNYIVNSNNYNNRPSIKNLPPFYTVGNREELLAKLIYDYKYDSTRAIGIKLAELLNRKLPNTLPPTTYIVTLPTYTKHVRERGFDHTLFVARRLAKINRKLKVSPLLVREKNTVQVGSDKKTRLLQASQAFKVKENSKIDSNATYLLLDDVWTTGASMLAAVKKLRAAGAKHIIIAELSVSILDT